MLTEEKLLDEIVEILDLIGYATETIADGDVIWSGNPIVYSGSLKVSSKLIRRKVNILKKDNASVKKKFQLYFDNVSKITSQISSINL